MRRDAEANQAKVVEAATRVLADRGLLAEITDIAEAAGVGVGTVYRCIGKRDDVIQTVAAQALAEIELAYGDAEAIDDPHEALVALFASLFEVVTTYGWFHSALIGGRLPEGFLAQIRAGEFDRRFERVYRRAREAGAVRGDVESGVATSLLLGAFAPWAAKGLLANRTPREAAEAIFGLVAPSTTKPRKAREEARD